MLEFKRFRIRLKSITPFHIGTGDEYYPVEYVLNRNKKKLCVIDDVKLLENVEKAGKLDEFAKLSSSPTSINRSLLDFIRRYANGYRYCDDVDELALNYISNERSAFRAGISKFIRNSLDDRVYIPGSTFKGALRSALIDRFVRALVKKENFESLTIENIKKALEKNNLECRDLDNLFNFKFLNDFPRVERKRNYNAAEDYFKYVKVSDFYPVGDYSATVYRAFSIGKPKEKEGQGKVREIKAIPDLLECVKGGVEFEGEVLIYDKFEEVLSKIKNVFGVSVFKNINANTVAQKFMMTYANVYNWELEYFGYREKFIENVDPTGAVRGDFVKLDKFGLSNSSEKNKFYIKLGKHGGAVSKTIKGCREIAIRVGRDVNVSNHQSTIWLAGGYPMGWLRGEVTEV